MALAWEDRLPPIRFHIRIAPMVLLRGNELTHSAGPGNGLVALGAD